MNQSREIDLQFLCALAQTDGRPLFGVVPLLPVWRHPSSVPYLHFEGNANNFNGFESVPLLYRSKVMLVMPPIL